jgi:putative ABC transport system ATP-binding protein
VAIARALVTGAQVILADEPTGNLDPDNKNKILDILFEQVKARAVTLVAVTHDHGLLDRFDRVVEFDGLEVGT